MQVTEQDVKKHSPQIRKMAHFWARKCCRLDLEDDLFQEGMLGMIQAYLPLDPAKGLPPQIFLTVRSRMQRFIRKNNSIVGRFGGNKNHLAVMRWELKIQPDMQFSLSGDHEEAGSPHSWQSPGPAPDAILEESELCRAVRDALDRVIQNIDNPARNAALDRLIIDEIFLSDTPAEYKQISAELGLQRHTVEKSVKYLKDKLREELTQFVMETQNRCDEYAITAVVNSLAAVAPGADGAQVAAKLSG